MVKIFKFVCLLFMGGLVAVMADTSKYTTSQLVANLHDLDTVWPRPVSCPLGCDLYLRSDSALGYNGPLGSLGPLGPLGAMSSHIWSPSDVFAWVGNFTVYMHDVLGLQGGVLTDAKNPLSAAGPLGDSFWDVMPQINDFDQHMEGLGIWSVLGPLGPLGALGALGPLGPVGAHALRISQRGDYVNSYGQIVRKIDAVYDETLNVSWPLFEKYASKSYVDRIGDLDTSFMVMSIANENGDSYTVNVYEPQYVTILATPVLWGKNFILKVYLGNKVIAQTNAILYSPWIQLYISEDDLAKHDGHLTLRIVVQTDLIDCGMIIANPIFHCSMEYYLYVVGSTRFMLRRPHLQYEGPYIKPLNI